jgi:hypothetical protein
LNHGAEERIDDLFIHPSSVRSEEHS